MTKELNIELGAIKIENPGKVIGNVIYDDTEYLLEKEFDFLYSKWYSSYCLSAHGSDDPAAKPHYEVLKIWCLKNKDEALRIINKKLKYEPSDLVRLLDDIYREEYQVSAEGFIPLDVYCNFWLNVINHTDNKNYYKDYNKWKKHLNKHYIPWNPFKENDPNVTLEEYQQGKRNKK